MSEEDTVALWYWRHHSLQFSLHDDEAEAANSAIYLEDDGAGSVAGVQFADGRLLCAPEAAWSPTGDWWPAYQEAEDRQYEADKVARETPRPYRPTRQITDPFGSGQVLTIDADEPDWLGVPPTEESRDE